MDNAEIFMDGPKYLSWRGRNKIFMNGAKHLSWRGRYIHLSLMALCCGLIEPGSTTDSIRQYRRGVIFVKIGYFVSIGYLSTLDICQHWISINIEYLSTSEGDDICQH